MSKFVFQEVKPFLQSLICDCGAEMVYDDVDIEHQPPVYLHTCPACGRLEGKEQAYPCICYRNGEKEVKQ